MYIYLVGGLEHFLFSIYVSRRIIPADEVIFFQRVETTNQICSAHLEVVSTSVRSVSSFCEAPTTQFTAAAFVAASDEGNSFLGPR